MIGLVILSALLQQSSEPVVVPAGTVIPVSLTSRVSTKHAREGDGVYGKTVFPITINNKIVIPEGSNLRGKITQIRRPGRVGSSTKMSIALFTRRCNNRSSFL